jgi:hypothetical protein
MGHIKKATNTYKELRNDREFIDMNQVIEQKKQMHEDKIHAEQSIQNVLWS